MRGFLRLLSQAGGKAKVAPWRHLSFFFPLLPFGWKCVCYGSPGDYILAVFLSSLSLWRPQGCRFLSATAAFEPLSNSLPKQTPICCLLRDPTVPRATCNISSVKASFVETVVGPPSWCCEEQQCLLLCLSNKNSAEKISLLPHEAQVGCLSLQSCPSCPGRVIIKHAEEGTWISSANYVETTSSCAIWCR